MRRWFRAVVALVTVASIAQLAGCAHASHDVRFRSVSSTRAGTRLAATRVVFWTTCPDVVALTDAQLDEWHGRGVGGFVCMSQRLADLGGDQHFSADARSKLSGDSFSLQRRIRDSKIVARARARGIELWLGFYLSNYSNHQTPLAEWFNDAAWSEHVIPRIAEVAGAARMLGFAGLAFDEEQYDGGSWDWNYKGNTHRESAVRAEVRARGTQMMKAIVRAFPGVDLIDYGSYFPDSWNALVQQQVNHTHDPYAHNVQVNLWDGLTRVRGYGAIRFVDATFYKTAHLPLATWDNAMTYNDNRLMAYFSRHLTNWAYASDRVNVSPFAWIDGDVKNEGSFTAPRSPAYVADQLAAFRRWRMGGVFAVFAYGDIEGSFDYRPYVPGLQAAARPGVVDSRPPTLTVSAIKQAAKLATISGIARDDKAIRSVACHTRAGSGAAAMTWSLTGGSDSTRYYWQMKWRVTIPAGSRQPITCTAVDAAHNTTTLESAAR